MQLLAFLGNKGFITQAIQGMYNVKGLTRESLLK